MLDPRLCWLYITPTHNGCVCVRLRGSNNDPAVLPSGAIRSGWFSRPVSGRRYANEDKPQREKAPLFESCSDVRRQDVVSTVGLEARPKPRSR